MMDQKLVRKLQSGVNWISSMSIHPQGDNVIIGSYDRKLCWFDMDLSGKPYRVLKYHKGAIRSVVFHARYPLFASCGEDGSVNVFYGMVYSDLMSNPLIVPLKSLNGHEGAVHDVTFHPTQPWVFSAGGDGLIKMYC
jgi:ribosome biogenesis protein ERB1